jgi:hypothetical protein
MKSINFHKHPINSPLVWMSVLFILHFLTAGGQEGTASRYTIQSLFQTGDVLHLTLNIVATGPHEVTAAGPEGILIRSTSGVFYVTPDTIEPVLTIFDTVPGTDECMGDLWGTGMSWRPGLEMMYKFGMIDARITEKGDVRIIFYYIWDRRIDFYSASPGIVTKLFDFPEKLMIGDAEFTFSDPFEAVWALAYAEPNGKPVVGIFWHRLDLWLEKNNKMAIFVYDGTRVEKLAAKGDMVSGTNVRIDVIGESKYRQQVLWNDSLTCCYFRASCPGDKGYGLYYSGHGQIHPILRKGQKLTGTEEIPYKPFGNIHEWHADFYRSTAYICLNNKDFVAASPGVVKRFPGWKSGDPVPGTGGGTIYLFGGEEEAPAEGATEYHPFYVFPDRMVAWIDIMGSELHIKEGIFSCRDGEITRLVAQKDAAPDDIGGTFTKIMYYEVLDENDLLFLAGVEGGKAESGIFLLSDGKIETVVTNAYAFTLTDRKGRSLNLSPEEVSITGFSAYDRNTIYFSASWTGGGGYFMARGD